MEITFDPAKDAQNVRERGLPFSRVVEIDFTTALLIEDTRKEYGETRYVALPGRTAPRSLLHRDGERHPRHQFSKGKRARGKKAWQIANP